jgi:hypothetical protein
MLTGGDGYTMLKEGRVIVSPGKGNLLPIALENLIEELGQVDPQFEGRIRFL